MLICIPLLLLTSFPQSARAEVERPAAVVPTPDFAPVPGVCELTGRLIVRPVQRQDLSAEGVPLEQVFERRRRARLDLRKFELVRHVAQTDEYILRVPAGQTEEQVAAALMATGDFEYAEPDWRLYPISPGPTAQGPPTHVGGRVETPPLPWPRCPDDPLFPAQWHHSAERIDSCQGWSLTTGTPTVSVGVCDTGLRTSHQDLQLHRLEAYNAVDQLWESEGGQIGPIHYHGTRTTGAVAANGNNGVGVAGLGWNLSHRMIRVSNQTDGGAYLSDLQHGARTAIESGDRIANVSYHGASYGSNQTTAAYIKSIGGLLLWGAGNTGANHSHIDRDADDLIVVGATDQNDALASFSVYGTFVDLVAPGVGILTTDSGSDHDYASADGTSYACPLTSGVCALIWSARPTLSPNDVELILKAGADDIGAPGIDHVFGYGRIDLPGSLAESGTTHPTAEFAGTPLSGVSPLVVEFTDLSTGVPTAWSWDFGDGQTSPEQNPTHTYTSSGAFTVSLVVSNSIGADQHVLIDYVLVDIIPPEAEFSGTPTAGLSPLTVQFQDESTGGIPTSWLWDFGDGFTSTQPDPPHTYTSSGFYTVSLTVTNAYGFDTISKLDYITVDYIPPVAGFSGLPTSGASPLVVDFTDESTMGAATSWQWYFGDSWTSTEQDPSHTYTAPGTYSVSLLVSNAYGSDQLWRTNYIEVGPGPPLLAEFEGTPLTGPAPLTVVFTDKSIGHITDWEWNFGDGGTSELQHPTHVFTTPGEYDIALQVGNADGADNGIEKKKYVVVQ